MSDGITDAAEADVRLQVLEVRRALEAEGCTDVAAALRRCAVFGHGYEVRRALREEAERLEREAKR